MCVLLRAASLDFYARLWKQQQRGGNDAVMNLGRICLKNKDLRRNIRYNTEFRVVKAD